MTVFFSKKCEYALQAILFMAATEDDSVCPAADISKKLSIPKEFVSKILQSLTNSRLVESKKGKGGGFKLAKHPSQIKPIEIVEAIDGLESFNTCVLGFPNCSDKNPCPAHNKWSKLRSEALKMLSEENLENFKAITIKKIKSL